MLTWCGRAGERSSHLATTMSLQHTRQHPTWQGWKNKVRDINLPEIWAKVAGSNSDMSWNGCENLVLKKKNPTSPPCQEQGRMQKPPAPTALPRGRHPIQHCMQALSGTQEDKQELIWKNNKNLRNIIWHHRLSYAMPRSDYDVFLETTEQNGGPKLLSGTKSNEGHVGTLA